MTSENDKDEYIDFLHDRIQFLEEELEASEKTVLELKQELDRKKKIVKAAGGIPRGREPEQFYRRIIDRIEEEARKRERRGEKVDKANEAIERMRHKVDNVWFEDEK